MAPRPALPQPGDRATQTVLVVEAPPHRAAGLKHEFSRSCVAVRGPIRIGEWTEENTGEVTVLDLANRSSSAIRLMARLRNASPPTMIVVIVPELLRDIAWPMWEVGADAVLEEPVSGERLCRVCRQLLSIRGADERGE